jgi:hypothetical protein
VYGVRQLSRLVRRARSDCRDQLVTLYAEQVLGVAEPVIRRVDASTFPVTRPGDGGMATISVTQPFKGKPCGILVITRVTNST